MAETLRDRVVQSAIGRVAVRAERQENVGQLAATFVDPGISVQLENDNNQILYGRRGTGKTHVLKVVERAAAANPNQFAVYLRRKDKARAMETVRSLSWGRFVFPPSEEAAYRKAPKYRGFLEEAHTGFEPVLPP